MVVTFVEAEAGSEVMEISQKHYPEGFYLANDQLWLKDKTGVVAFIWSSVQSYFSSPINEVEQTPERGDTISEEFLLKVLAVAKQPDLITEL